MVHLLVLSKYVSVCRAVFSMLCSFFRLLIILIISILMTELSAFISTVTQPLAVIRSYPSHIKEAKYGTQPNEAFLLSKLFLMHSQR